MLNPKARSTWIAFALAAAIIIVSRLPSLARPIWNVDEAHTAVTADVLLKGGMPYRDSVDHRAPLTYFVYEAVFALAGRNNMLALHVALIGLVVGLLALIALLARQVLRTPGVIFCLFYFAATSSVAFWPDECFAFHTEWIVIVCTSAGVLLCWRALSRPRPLPSAVLCGICYGLACFTKQPAGFDVLATLTFLGILAAVGPQAGTGVSRRQVLAIVVGIVIGGILVAGFVCGYFWVRGAWDDFAFYVWTYNTQYYMSAVPLLQKLQQVYAAYFSLLPSLGLRTLATCGGVLCVTRAAGWFGERTPVMWRQFHVALWGISALLAGLVGGRAYGHYFIMLLPPWCLLAGFTFDYLLALLRPVFPVDLTAVQKWSRIALLFVLAVWLFGLHLLVQAANIGRYQQMISDWIQNESKERVLSYIQRECPPTERIVVWGFYPQLYVEADREPATRFSYPTFVVGIIPGSGPMPKEEILRRAVPGTAETFLNEVRTNHPLLIIDVGKNDPTGFALFPLSGWKELAQILSDSYELVPEFSPGAPGDDGSRVYRRHD